ncbi:MAG: ABC transporter ATP-binding protein [Bacillaceae bacterium]
MDSIKRYFQFVKPYWIYIFLTIIIGVIKFSIPLILPYLLKIVIDDIIPSTASLADKTNQLMYVMGIGFFIFIVVRPPIEYIRQYLAQWIGSKVLYDLRSHLFGHLQKLSLRYYANSRTGEIISRVINDVEQTKDFVITGLMNVWLDMITILIVLGIMMTMSVKLTLVSLIVMPLYAISVKYFFSRLRMRTRERSQALATLQGYLHERIQGISVTRSFAHEDYEQKQFGKKNGAFLTKALNHTKWNAKTFAVVNTIADIGPLIVISFAAYSVIHEGLSLGSMVAFVGYIDRLYDPLRRLVNSSTTLTQAFASMDRVFELLDVKYDIVDKQDAIVCEKLAGKIQFNNVSFRYNEDDHEVLKDVSLTIEPGQKIALVGASGGGKSSLVSLIPRFYDTSKGSITIDDIPITDYATRSLRKQIGIVLQDNLLFSESIRDNILYGNPQATEAEVIAAAKAARAHEFIMEFPNGYDTLVGERGIKLSGGQRQRIAIARVFLKNPSLLILDEATSALDLENERYIQEALNELAENRTTIFIAHRLSTITHVDKIIYIENGEIREEGSHEELMKKQGYYYDLFQNQHIQTEVTQ